MTATARPSSLTEQRLQRLCLWLALTVARFVAPVLNAVAPHAAARLLNEYARNARMLLVARAVKRIAFRRGPIPLDGRRLKVRAVAGGALRRALGGGAGAICAVLADAERWIAHVTRRLQRGFTKLRRLPKPRRARVIAAASAPMALASAADTS